MVPEGWRRVEIGEAGAVVTGATPATNNPAFYEGGNVPFVSPADLGGGTDILDAGKVITEEGLAQVRGVPKGSTLFVCIGSTIGKIGFATRDLATNQQINSVVPFAENDPRFVFYAIALRARHIARLAGNQAVPIINKSQFSGEMIDLPPLAEQKRIAEVLGVWDRATLVAGKQLDLARTQKRALMQTLLTPTRRFPGYEGQPWKEVRLGDVAEINMGSSPKSEAYNDAGDGLPLIQGNADIKNRQTVPRAFTTEITQTCEVGDILMSVRAPVGTVAVSAHRACVGRGAAVVLPKHGCDWGWLFQCMLFLEDKWAKVSQGSTFDAVNSKDMKSVLVNFPKDLGEQRAIAATLETADAEITTLETQITRLQAEKKALMQQLLTGQKRLAV